MAAFNNYSFKNVNVIYGIYELEGFNDGDDVVSIIQNVEQFTTHVGAKGDVTRAQSADNSCTITIKFQQTSKSNAVLNGIYVADRETGASYYPMTIQDKETGETYVINNVWIQKFPDIIRGQGVNSMDWVFQGDFFTPVITG